MKFTYIDLCAGCGGLTRGLEDAGLKAVALYEKDKDCIKTLKKNFQKTKIKKVDIKKQSFKKYKNKVDIVVGGIPCQSFSIAGERKGLKDKRGQLIYEFIRCVKEVKPKLFMIENVEGLLNVNKG